MFREEAITLRAHLDPETLARLLCTSSWGAAQQDREDVWRAYFVFRWGLEHGAIAVLASLLGFFWQALIVASLTAFLVISPNLFAHMTCRGNYAYSFSTLCLVQVARKRDELSGLKSTRKKNYT